MNKFVLFFVFCLLAYSSAKKSPEKPDWAKKDIRDYTDVDLERLLDQWEEDEEPLEPDELPEHLRPQPQIDFSQIQNKDPEELMKLTKKGRTLMTFVQVSDNPTKQESETLTQLWQTSLFNNHISCERYLIDDNRAIFMFKDGAQAFEAKDFLIDQERCESVTIDSKVYEGKYSSRNKAKTEL